MFHFMLNLRYSIFIWKRYIAAQKKKICVHWKLINKNVLDLRFTIAFFAFFEFYSDICTLIEVWFELNIYLDLDLNMTEKLTLNVTRNLTMNVICDLAWEIFKNVSPVILLIVMIWQHVFCLSNTKCIYKAPMWIIIIDNGSQTQNCVHVYDP